MKVRACGIKPAIVRGKEVWPRFHDACKVTQVSALSQAGVSLGDIAHLSNTTKEVLMKHYIKADREDAFSKYLSGGPSLDPQLGPNRANVTGVLQQEPKQANDIPRR
jgi:hypothetical protein